MNSIHAVLQPNLHREYCDYFYYLMVINVIVGTLVVADFFLSSIKNLKNIKNFSSFMMNHMGSKIIQLLSIMVHFFIIRLLYSMCYRSLPIQQLQEGYRGGLGLPPMVGKGGCPSNPTKPFCKKWLRKQGRW